MCIFPSVSGIEAGQMGNFTAQMAFHLANGWSTMHSGNFLAHPWRKGVRESFPREKRRGKIARIVIKKEER